MTARAWAVSLVLVVVACTGSPIASPSPQPTEEPTATPTATVPPLTPSPTAGASATLSPTAVPAPAGRWVPKLVDVPGDGVLMLSGLVPPGNPPAKIPDMWHFGPTAGWHELVTEREPDPWDDHLSYDAAAGVVWLSAADADGGPREIWELDPATNEWTQVETAGGPAGGGHYIAFDTESRQLIHFGGWLGDDFDNQTWAYGVDTGLWQEMSPAQRPAGRHASAMAYDASSDRVVLYGGWGNNAGGSGPLWFYDTWTYDFNTDTWTEMTPDVGPRRSSGGSMTYDAAGDRVLLFDAAASTWAYDFANDTWTELATAARPSAREIAGMAYDAESGVVVLFGGRAPDTSSTPDDTWLFDVATDSWTEWAPP